LRSISFEQWQPVLTARSRQAYPEFMHPQLTFCCCRRSPLAYTEAR